MQPHPTVVILGQNPDPVLLPLDQQSDTPQTDPWSNELGLGSGGVSSPVEVARLVMVSSQAQSTEEGNT